MPPFKTAAFVLIPGLGGSRLWREEAGRYSLAWLDSLSLVSWPDTYAKQLAPRLEQGEGLPTFVDDFPICMEDLGGTQGISSLQFVDDPVTQPSGIMLCPEGTRPPESNEWGVSGWIRSVIGAVQPSKMTHVAVPGTGVMDTWIERLEAHGVPSQSIRGIPLDWRLPPWSQNWRSVREALEAGPPAIIIAHSLGGMYMSYFLSEEVDEEWKRKHVRLFVPLGAPLLGAGAAVTMFMEPQGVRPIGDVAKDLLWDPTQGLHVVVRNFTSIFTKLPSAFATLPDDFPTLSPSYVDVMAKRFRPYLKPVRQDSGTETLCVFGKGIPTTVWDSELKGVTNVEGDGVVEAESSGACAHWELAESLSLEASHHDLLHNPLTINSVITSVSDIIKRDDQRVAEDRLVGQLLVAFAELGAKTKEVTLGASPSEIIVGGAALGFITIGVLTVLQECRKVLGRAGQSAAKGVIAALGGVTQEEIKEPSNCPPQGHYRPMHDGNVSASKTQHVRYMDPSSAGTSPPVLVHNGETYHRVIPVSEASFLFDAGKSEGGISLAPQNLFNVSRHHQRPQTASQALPIRVETPDTATGGYRWADEQQYRPPLEIYMASRDNQTTIDAYNYGSTQKMHLPFGGLEEVKRPNTAVTKLPPLKVQTASVGRSKASLGSSPTRIRDEVITYPKRS